MSKFRLSSIQSLVIVVASFIIASVFNVYPLSITASALRPRALMMVLVFWLMYQPRKIGVIVAFAVGIIADLLLDTRLGQQGFSAVVMAFVVRFICIYLREMSFAVVWTVAGAALIVFQIALWVVQYMTQSIFIGSSVYSLIISVVTWPFIYFALIRFSK